jgi:hypothetical protein
VSFIQSESVEHRFAAAPVVGACPSIRRAHSRQGDALRPVGYSLLLRSPHAAEAAPQVIEFLFWNAKADVPDAARGMAFVVRLLDRRAPRGRAGYIRGSGSREYTVACARVLSVLIVMGGGGWC